MRIISQDGVYDLPYDMCILALDENSVVAGVIGEETPIEMAFYQNRDTAMEEMKRLRRSYGIMDTGFFKFKEDISSAIRPLDKP